MRKKPDVTPPENILPRKLDIIEQKRKYELITPLYGGGVTTAEDDPTITNRADPITVVRATEIRGQLRFWWRVMRGGQSEGKSSLKKREDAIWGKAYEKGDKGIKMEQTIQIVVDVSQEGTPIKPFYMDRQRPKPDNGIPDYVSFPLQPDQNERKKANPVIPDVRKGVQFLLTIAYPTSMSKEIEAALWAWETFGGLGARTRRGFGALHLLEIDGDAHQALPTFRNVEQWIRSEARKHNGGGGFPTDFPHLNSEIQLAVTRSFNSPMQAWNDLIVKLQKFRQQKDESKPGAQYEKAYNKRSAWPEADAIRSIAGKGSAPDIKKFPRAAFGLPIIFHFTGKNAENVPTGNYTLNEADMERECIPGEDLPHRERFASPLILRPFQCSDGMAVGLALLLEGPRVDLKQLVLQVPKNEGGKSQYVEGTLTTNETRKITAKIEDLQKETDVLQAFMKLLKRG